MGAVKGSVTIRRYVVRGGKPEPSKILKGARAHALVPIDPASDSERVHGWALVHDPDDTAISPEQVFTADGKSALLSLRVDVLKPPSQAVKRLAAEKLKALGRKPTRRDKQEAKALAVRELRSRAFPRTTAVDTVWRLDEGRVYFFSHGKKLNELLLDLFGKSFGVQLVPAGPGLVAGEAGAQLEPTAELAFGFPGMPGRPADGEDDDDQDDGAEDAEGSDA